MNSIGSRIVASTGRSLAPPPPVGWRLASVETLDGRSSSALAPPSRSRHGTAPPRGTGRRSTSRARTTHLLRGRTVRLRSRRTPPSPSTQKGRRPGASRRRRCARGRACLDDTHESHTVNWVDWGTADRLATDPDDLRRAPERPVVARGVVDRFGTILVLLHRRGRVACHAGNDAEADSTSWLRHRATIRRSSCDPYTLKPLCGEGGDATRARGGPCAGPASR
jgi:hypothetical protein